MNDEKLLKLIRENPDEGAKKLIRQYAELVFGIVKTRLDGVCGKTEQKDLTADVLTDFLQSAGEFRGETSIKNYLCLIARNAAVDLYRKKLPEISLESETLTLELKAATDVEAEAERKRLLSEITEAVLKLGHPDSDIIFAKYWFGESTKSVAARLRMTVSAVDTRASRAIAAIRERFGDERK